MDQSKLSSENFDLCRICLFEPESNRQVSFFSIFDPVAHPTQTLNVFSLMVDLLGVNIDFNDVKPKIICQNCFNSLVSWFEFKEKMAESEIVLNYIATKRIKPSMTRSTIASTSTLMLTNNDQSSQGSSFQSSRVQANQENIYGPSTSRASFPSSSSMMIENYEISNQPSTSSQTLFNNINESTQASTSNCPQEKPQRSNANKKKTRGVSSKPIIATCSNSEFVEESDDDCIIVTPPIETVDLISSDENENVDEDSSDHEESIALSRHDVAIELSSDSDNNMDFENKDCNDKTEKLYYCSICQKKTILNHDCSQHTQSFFTCLVPNCNILSRSRQHFTSHYQLHIGMSSSAILCHHCFQEIEQSNIDGNGCHVRCNTVNAFKCFTCNNVFNSMQEFAFHKLKTHNGLLMNVHGNYLCLHCEESSPELAVINDHMKYCLAKQASNVTAANMKHKKPTNLKNVTVRKNGKNSLTSQHILFTCLKPNCNLVFQTFRIFKLHYRSHYNLGDALMCWQCCKPFSDTSGLRNHQLKVNCRTPGMFKCFECPDKFDNLEGLSIHKFTYHNGNLMACKKNKKTIVCAFCKMNVIIFDFKSHLATCKKKNVNKTTCSKKDVNDTTCSKKDVNDTTCSKKGVNKTTCSPNDKPTYKCLICEKVFFSSVSLSNHSRIHKRARTIVNLKQE